MKMDPAMWAFHNGFCQWGCTQEDTPHSEAKEPPGRDNPQATLRASEMADRRHGELDGPKAAGRLIVQFVDDTQGELQ
jgi:hypothetical protein